MTRLQFDVRHIHIPFRFQYGHRLKSHRGLDAVICIASDGEGLTGLGEAVPRDYVTGETCDSVMQVVRSIAEQTAADSTDRDSLIAQRTAFAEEWAGPFPSCALSAIDLARCDLFAQRERVALSQWLGNLAPSGKLAKPTADGYCASLGFGAGWKGRSKLAALAAVYRCFGFKQFKVKVGNADDQARLKFIQGNLPRGSSTFADANTAWAFEQAVESIEMLAQIGVWAIEEPLQMTGKSHVGRAAGGAAIATACNRLAAIDDQHLERIGRLRAQTPLPIVADESLICMQSLNRILQAPSYELLNIRLSKCGGPLLSMQMVRLAKKHRLDYAVAAMVGETPILATAGAHFAAACAAHGAPPKYTQGYSHRLLHRVVFAHGEPPLRRASVEIPTAAGLGLQLHQPALDAVTRARLQFEA